MRRKSTGIFTSTHQPSLKCVERHDRGDGILFEASASLNRQLLLFSREALRRDAQEVDRLGDVLDFLLGHARRLRKGA
jgi:hypothetical protein